MESNFKTYSNTETFVKNIHTNKAYHVRLQKNIVLALSGFSLKVTMAVGFHSGLRQLTPQQRIGVAC